MLVEEKTSGELKAQKLLDERVRLEESIQEMRLQGNGIFLFFFIFIYFKKIRETQYQQKLFFCLYYSF